MQSNKEPKRRQDAAATVPFRGFDPDGDVRIYDHGLLPHWRQSGATYFVTFRLADALPRSVVVDWKSERNDWLRRHEIDPGAADWRHDLRNLPPEKVIAFERHFGKRLDRQLDAGYGACLLRDPEAGKMVEHALRYFHGERVWMGDYVVMPNHAHALMRPMGGFELEDLLHSIKSFTAHRINEITGNRGTVWQKESYDRIVRDGHELAAFQNYIHANPEKARLRDGSYRVGERVNYETI